MILELYNNLIEKEGIDKSSFVGCLEDNIEDMINKIKIENNICEPEELEGLTMSSLPKSIIDFLKNYISDDDIDLGADVIQLGKQDFVKENTQLMPGALMVGFKYLTFASTTGGNAICFNLNEITDGEPSIYIVDHSIVSGRKVGISHGMEMEFFSLDNSNVHKVVKKVASSFSELLNILINDEISDIETFLY